MQNAHALRRLTWPAFWLGFVLSGFFDGILLHQVLHAQRYQRRRYSLPDTDGRLLSLAHVRDRSLGAMGAMANASCLQRRRSVTPLLGMATRWHRTGIHRIKLDAENPLLYDIGWLVLFGAIPLAIGWMLKRVVHMIAQSRTQSSQQSR